MKNFKLLWNAVLTVFFVCCIQTYSGAQDLCELPTSLEVVPVLVNSGPGFCEYELTLDSDVPLEEGVHCTEWIHMTAPDDPLSVQEGGFSYSFVLECEQEPETYCVRIRCCEEPFSTVSACATVEPDCCSTPCEPADFSVIDVSTPNVPCELRIELGGGTNGYCIDWIVDGTPYASGEDLNHIVIEGCENNGPHEVCVLVRCCETGEFLFEFCDTYILDCPCPCEPADVAIDRKSVV